MVNFPCFSIEVTKKLKLIVLSKMLIELSVYTSIN